MVLRTPATRTCEDTSRFFPAESRLQGTWGQETFAEDAVKWCRDSSGSSLAATRAQGRTAGAAMQPTLGAGLAVREDAHGTEFALLYMREIVSSTLCT